jgi:hypothetical protein
MGSVMNPPRPPSVRVPPRVFAIVAAVVVAAGGLFLVRQHLMPSPSRVDRVTIVNPTPYDLEVDVAGAGRATGLTLGAVGRDQTKTIEDVVDQGRQWVFTFRHGHDEAGALTIAKEQLAGDHWQVTIPASVADRLAGAGAFPSPRP